MRTLKFAVDVDEVVLDLIGEWILNRYNTRYGRTLTLEDVNQWDMTQVCPDAGFKVYDILREPGFYQSVQPIEGALEAVQAARFFGHRIVFVSSCVVGTVDDKVSRLIDLGFLPNGKTQRDFIAASDKALVSADVLIDDNADNVEAWLKTGRDAYLVNMPHNRQAKTKARRVANLGEAIRDAVARLGDDRF